MAFLPLLGLILSSRWDIEHDMCEKKHLKGDFDFIGIFKSEQISSPSLNTTLFSSKHIFFNVIYHIAIFSFSHLTYIFTFWLLIRPRVTFKNSPGGKHVTFNQSLLNMTDRGHICDPQSQNTALCITCGHLNEGSVQMSGDLRAKGAAIWCLMCFGVFSQHAGAGRGDRTGMREGNALDRPG